MLYNREMKICIQCKEEKSTDSFYRDKYRKDGFTYRCIPCYEAKREREDPSNVRKRATRYGLKTGWKQQAEMRKKYPEKYRARTALINAVRLGKIYRPPECSRCLKSGRVQGHHFDYSRPLDVIWLCQKCHTREHHGKNWS